MKRLYNNHLSLGRVPSFRQAGKAILALGALFLLASVALAQGDYDLSWWTVDGGGYTFSAGGGYSLGGTGGQPDPGPALDGDDYTLVGGFWSGAGATAGPEPGPVYLPIVMKDYCGPDNYEPNAPCDQAYGPLTFGQTYQSWISCYDVDFGKDGSNNVGRGYDYFSITMATGGTVSIVLSNIPPGQNYDLYLYQGNCSTLIDGGQYVNTISEDLGPGTYYILVYSGIYGQHSTSPYSLQVTSQ